MTRAVKIDGEERPTTVDAGPAPILQWIAIDRLVIDDAYQRDLKRNNWTAIHRIAGAFRWSRFSPVLVAPVEGGRFAIIDGQHRTHAAALCGMEEVPCQIVQMDHAEQAAAFAAVNGQATKVTLFQVFKAALVAGDAWAVDAAVACKQAGCRLMTFNSSAKLKKPGEIYAIRLVHQHVQAGKTEALTACLYGIRQSKFGEDAEAYGGDVLKPTLDAFSSRPWLVEKKDELAGFFDAYLVFDALDKADEFRRNNRRSGLYGVTKAELAAAEIGTALDRRFPRRMAMPSKSDVMKRLAGFSTKGGAA